MPPAVPLSVPRAATRSFVDYLESLAAHEPAALLGVLYVMEGSRMGSLVLGPRLAQGFGLPVATGVGLDYHVADAALVPARWRVTKQRMDDGLTVPAEMAAATDAVRQTFAHMMAVYEAVWLHSDSRVPHLQTASQEA